MSEHGLKRRKLAARPSFPASRGGASLTHTTTSGVLEASKRRRGGCSAAATRTPAVNGPPLSHQHSPVLHRAIPRWHTSFDPWQLQPVAAFVAAELGHRIVHRAHDDVHLLPGLVGAGHHSLRAHCQLHTILNLPVNCI
eukprot:362607-Chlamydomonas_euryale.AAC.2